VLLERDDGLARVEGLGMRRREEGVGRRQAGGSRAREWRARGAGGCSAHEIENELIFPLNGVSLRYRGLGNDAESFHHGETIFSSLLPISCKKYFLADVSSH
jgi:hypothetical protein